MLIDLAAADALWHEAVAWRGHLDVLVNNAGIYEAARPDGDLAAWRGEDGDYWHYAAAKAGVVAMTKTIARQYGRQGVTAFAVAPGFVDTPFNAPAVAEHGMELFINDTALGEVAQPQDVANVIAFLASGKARHATGATIDVNSASYVR